MLGRGQDRRGAVLAARRVDHDLLVNLARSVLGELRTDPGEVGVDVALVGLPPRIRPRDAAVSAGGRVGRDGRLKADQLLARRAGAVRVKGASELVLHLDLRALDRRSDHVLELVAPAVLADFVAVERCRDVQVLRRELRVADGLGGLRVQEVIPVIPRRRVGELIPETIPDGRAAVGLEPAARLEHGGDDVAVRDEVLRLRGPVLKRQRERLRQLVRRDGHCCHSSMGC